MELEELGKSSLRDFEEKRNISAPPYLYHSFAHISFVHFLLCVVSVGVSLVVFMSTWWCKKPISPGLILNMSLILANLLIGILVAAELLLSDAIPALFQNNGNYFCLAVNLRIVCQGCTLISVLHFPAIQINAWMTLAKTNYMSVMTRGKVQKLVCMMWLAVIVGTLSYFFVSEIFTVRKKCLGLDALKRLLWKIIYFLCCFGSFIATLVFFSQLQKLLRQRSRTTARFQSSGTPTRRMYGNLNLTCGLLLLTSGIGILPESLWNLLICENCLFYHSQIPVGVQQFSVLIFQTILILKTLAVPVIFAVQVSEIEVGLRQMACGLIPGLCISCASKSPPLINI